MTAAEWLATRPNLTRENERVVAVWNFCGGWNPEAVPMAAVFYGVDDVELLIAQLLEIRSAVEKYQAAQRS